MLLPLKFGVQPPSQSQSGFQGCGYCRALRARRRNILRGAIVIWRPPASGNSDCRTFRDVMEWHHHNILIEPWLDAKVATIAMKVTRCSVSIVRLCRLRPPLGLRTPSTQVSAVYQRHRLLQADHRGINIENRHGAMVQVLALLMRLLHRRHRRGTPCASSREDIVFIAFPTRLRITCK